MIEFNKYNGIYTLKSKQKLKTSLSKSWEFYSNPKNLSKITPKHMNFKILTDFNKIHKGQIIKYRVSPFPFLRVGWTTEITHVEKPISFVDKQIVGPFSFWEHEHIFKENSSGVYAYDTVTFKLPLGIIGRIFGGWIVKNQLKNIFEYRKNRLEKIFNTIDFK